MLLKLGVLLALEQLLLILLSLGRKLWLLLLLLRLCLSRKCLEAVVRLSGVHRLQRVDAWRNAFAVVLRNLIRKTQKPLRWEPTRCWLKDWDIRLDCNVLGRLGILALRGDTANFRT